MPEHPVTIIHPDLAKYRVGDQLLEVRLIARIYSIEQSRIDVTSYGPGEDSMPGETRGEIAATTLEIKPA